MFPFILKHSSVSQNQKMKNVTTTVHNVHLICYHGYIEVQL